jgi:N-acetylmuramoyl-L-alanine amidase
VLGECRVLLVHLCNKMRLICTYYTFKKECRANLWITQVMGDHLVHICSFDWKRLASVLLLAWATSSQAGTCLVGGVNYQCSPYIPGPWQYTAYWPNTSTGATSLSLSDALAQADANISALVKSWQGSTIDFGALSDFVPNLSSGTNALTKSAQQQTAIHWYFGGPPETDSPVLVYAVMPISCPSDATLYWGTNPPVCLGAVDAPPKVVVIDPGHGFSCPANGMRIGSIGATDFLPNDPPAGRLREDDLTIAIAREVQRLAPAKYKIILTKSSATTCPSFLDRGRIANNANAKVFVSVHVDARNFIPGNPFDNGSLGIYNSGKPAAKPLADLLAGAVSSNLGVNNRGSKTDDSLAVLKPTVTTMTAAIIESARLSGDDEVKLHTAGSATRIATGIIAALDAFLGN